MEMKPSSGWCQIKRSAFASNLCSNLLAAFVILITVHPISFLQGHNTAKSIKWGKGFCNRNKDCISFYKKRDSPGGEDWLIHICLVKTAILHSTAPKFSKRSWSRLRTLRRTIKSSIKKKYSYIQASHWNIAVFFCIANNCCAISWKQRKDLL